MKANEAPEKIYRTTTYLNNKGEQTVWKKQPVAGAENIEYIRTDAFVEKALRFIKTNVDRIVNNQHGVCMGCMDREFKKYMKGKG
ncbi:MAG: hypothetical protein J6X31_07515 [Bacteroidales bacterium]|nr:hypothetical protein [Bacteroidales bacterium]